MTLPFAVVAVVAASVVGCLLLLALRGREWGPVVAGLAVMLTAYALGVLAGRWLS